MITRLWRWLSEGGRRHHALVHCPECDPGSKRMKTATVNRDPTLPGGPLWHCFRCDRGGAW